MGHLRNYPTQANNGLPPQQARRGLAGDPGLEWGTCNLLLYRFHICRIFLASIRRKAGHTKGLGRMAVEQFGRAGAAFAYQLAQSRQQDGHASRLRGLRRKKSLLRRLRTRRMGHHAQAHDSRSRRDRKSTRLNSSHVEISYAVFCLKKKKKNTKKNYIKKKKKKKKTKKKKKKEK